MRDRLSPRHSASRLRGRPRWDGVERLDRVVCVSLSRSGSRVGPYVLRPCTPLGRGRLAGRVAFRADRSIL